MLQEDREVESELSSEEDLHNVEKHATDAMTKNVNKSEARLSFTSSRYVIKLNFPKTNIPILFINIAKRCWQVRQIVFAKQHYYHIDIQII